jgi:hypothetical protein
VPIDLVILLWLGATFGYCARERVRVDGLWAQPSLALVGTFLLMVVVPVGFYLYLVHPSWSWLYLIDPERLPALVVVPMVAVHALVLVGAYALGGRLVRAGRDVALRWAIAVSPALILLVVILLRERLFRYGSYGEFHQGLALPLFSVKLGYVLVAVVAGGLAAAVFVAWELTQDGRRAATR